MNSNEKKRLPIFIAADKKHIFYFMIICFAFFWLFWEFGGVFGNWGLESGYYGQFNRVKHVIEDMPGVAIVDYGLHEDITLEDFGFTLLVEGNRKVEVIFSENSPQMYETDKLKIREFIQKEIDQK